MIRRRLWCLVDVKVVNTLAVRKQGHEKNAKKDNDDDTWRHGSNETEISHERGVVANRLKLYRNGAGGCIDWLDLASIAESESTAWLLCGDNVLLEFSVRHDVGGNGESSL